MTTHAVLATLYTRIRTARMAIESIAKQVDKVHVVLNRVAIDEDVEHWINQLNVANNILFTLSDNKLGDAERYRPVNNKRKAYYLSIDDDLIYPANYVEYMVSQCDRYNTPVTLHGRWFNVRQVNSYYRDGWESNAIDVFRCRFEVKEDAPVHVPGSGVMCWRTDQIDLRYTQMIGRNRADIECARIAAQSQCDIICLAHPVGWLSYVDPDDLTIYDAKCWDDGDETVAMNEVLRILHETGRLKRKGGR